MHRQREGLIKNCFGSRRGFARTLEHYIRYAAGEYKSYKKIDFKKVNRLILVCSGNICRSALAEVVAKEMGIKADSFGLDCRGGDPADPRAVTYAKSIGLSLSEHITKNIKDYEERPGDLLVGMEPKHVHSLELITGLHSQITLAGLWLTIPKPYLHDPFNTNITFFNQCEALVTKATRSLAKRVKT